MLNLFFVQDPAAEVRMKVASITEQVLTLVNKRLGLYRHMDEVVNRYKQSRDTGALNSGRKTLEADHRALTNEISSLQARLKAEGSDLAEKVCVRVCEVTLHKMCVRAARLICLFRLLRLARCRSSMARWRSWCAAPARRQSGWLRVRSRRRHTSRARRLWPARDRSLSVALTVCWTPSKLLLPHQITHVHTYHPCYTIQLCVYV